jgi:hypothetical protein
MLNTIALTVNQAYYDAGNTAHKAMTKVSELHATVKDCIDTVIFLDELFQENIGDTIVEFIHNIAEYVIAYATYFTDDGTVKAAHDEIMKEDEVSASKSFRITVSAFVATFVKAAQSVQKAVETTFNKSLESLKAEAKALGVKGWNLYKSTEKLEAAIALKTALKVTA